MENNDNEKTTVTLNADEIKAISDVLKGTEKLSSFVHLAINELIDKRRTEKNLIKDGDSNGDNGKAD